MGVFTHQTSGERRLPTPEWAVNDELLRELLTVFMEGRAGFRSPGSGSLRERLDRAQKAVMWQHERLNKTVDELCREYVEVKTTGIVNEVSDEYPCLEGCEYLIKEKKVADRLRELEIEIEGYDTFLRYTDNRGGADMVAAVVFLYYRVCLDSVGVAETLRLKPPHVRRLLYNLHRVAYKLWPEIEMPSGFGPLFEEDIL